MEERTQAKRKWAKLIICLVFGLLLSGLAPVGAPAVGWNVFSVFASVLLSFVLRPLPMGPMVLLGLVCLSASGTIPLSEALAGYGDTTVWLVVAAFLVAGAVVRTEFGKRVALTLVSALGKSMLGLGYAICGAELLLGPVVPSNTARGGGIMAPIVHSLSQALGSRPDSEPQRAGSWLALLGAHANLIAAAMFLTGMAANPLVARAADDVLGVELSWGAWALGALVPGLAGMALLPLVLFRLNPPQLVDAEPARQKAREELKRMGKWSRNEKLMAFTFVVLILLWTTKSVHGLGTSLVAWIGVCLLFLSGAESWEDMTSNMRAWDTLIWLGGLLAMANALKNHGFIAWFSESVSHAVTGFDGLAVILILALIYFYSMYAFSMLTAHISAMVAAFMVVALATGAPPMLTAVLLAYFSNLCACTTNYSSGPVIIYFGLGYVPVQRWFTTGFLISLFHLAIWLGLGLPWWKFLGWW